MLSYQISTHLSAKEVETFSIKLLGKWTGEAGGGGGGRGTWLSSNLAAAILMHRDDQAFQWP